MYPHFRNTRHFSGVVVAQSLLFCVVFCRSHFLSPFACSFSFDQSIACPSIYRFWLPLWYLVAIVLSVLLYTDSDYPFGILWPLCCLSFYIQILITSFGILWPLCCLSFYIQILITPLVSCGHCVVCPSIYRFWLPLWYLQACYKNHVFLSKSVKVIVTF